MKTKRPKKSKASLEPHKQRLEPLDHELGPPPKPSVEEALNLELKNCMLISGTIFGC